MPADPAPPNPTPTPTPTPTPNPAPWFTGADPELIGHIQTHGWDAKPLNEVALEAVKSHREAQKMMGVPADRLIRLPTDPNDQAAWKAVWNKLGAPVDANGYDFASIKRADGTELDKPLADTLRTTVARLNLTKDAATGIVADVVKMLDTTAKATSDAAVAAAAEGKAELKKVWGVNEATNLVVAQNAAKTLGVPAEAIAALEKMEGVGYAKVMEMFRLIGTKIGEDNFIPPGARQGVMTSEMATARKVELMGDATFVERFMKSETLAVKEMYALDAIISGFTGA